LARGAATGFATAFVVAAAAAALAAGTAGFAAGVAFAAAGGASALAATAGFEVVGEAAGPGFAFPSASGLARPSACSTEARKSTSMRNGDPEEYSAWNITFHDWQIMRSRMIGSWAENCARRQSR